MKMRFTTIPKDGNFYLPTSSKEKNGLRIDVLIEFIEQSSPDKGETDKPYCKEIKQTDLDVKNDVKNTRRTNDVKKRERAKINLRRQAMNCLNTRERAEAMRYSTLLHTYPYISKATRNGSIEWIAESTRRIARATKELKRDNKKGIKTFK